MWITKCFFPRKCFVCGIWGGFGKRNIESFGYEDAVGYMDAPSNSYHYHHHIHCITDVVCEPEDYTSEVIGYAIHVFNCRRAIDIKRKKSEDEIQKQIGFAQEVLCEEVL